MPCQKRAVCVCVCVFAREGGGARESFLEVEGRATDARRFVFWTSRRFAPLRIQKRHNEDETTQESLLCLSSGGASFRVFCFVLLLFEGPACHARSSVWAILCCAGALSRELAAALQQACHEMP